MEPDATTGVDPAETELHERARGVLKRYWGYSDFRKGQWDAMAPVLKGRDALVILPTGGGKSLCYQVPALLQKGITLVISPLLALMEDQVARLKTQGVSATAINSTLSFSEIEQRWNDAVCGRYRLVYMAPERLQSEMFVARADQLNVSILAVDEAHCVSEWGYSFRPAYLQIAEARKLIKDPVTIAVTATATPYVRRDMMERLGLRSPAIVVTGFDRPNLTWTILQTENKRDKLLEIVTKVRGTGIVYAGTRRGVEKWAMWLRKRGISATHYHGGMSPEERNASQEEWLHGRTRVMVATNAFGMGIDKPDVRFVAHVDLPATVESYYQEAGRGGRDGKRAHAVLLYRKGDEATPRGLLARSHPERRVVQAVYDAFCSLNQVALAELPDRPLILDPERISRIAKCSISTVRSVLELLERQHVISVHAPIPHTFYIRFLQPPDGVRLVAESTPNAALARFVVRLLRNVPPESFSGWSRASSQAILRQSRMSVDRLLRGLDFLKERQLLEWVPSDAAISIQLIQQRSARLALDDSLLRKAHERSETRLNDILRYAHSDTCRRRFLLAYFGESTRERCGACDVCLGRHKQVVVTPSREPMLRKILAYVGEGTPREMWFAPGAPPAYEIEGLVDWLIQEEYLSIRDPLGQLFSLTEKAERLLRRT